MENYKYGRLTLIEKTSTKYKDGTYFHLFKCDCGTSKLILLRRVIKGDTRSCGCLAAEGASARLLGKCPTNKRSEYDRAINWSYHELKSTSKNRNLELSLTIKDIENIVFKNCYYCNAAPNRFIKHTRDMTHVKIPVNGIDRYKNHVGYHADNCVPCCKRCNYFKKDINGDEFLALIATIYHNVIV